jgi:hypothetical protein
MRDRTVRRSPVLILIVAGLLLALSVCSPRFAQATRQAQATDDMRVAGTVTPGPTTMPPELTMTSSYTGPCDFSALTVALALTNTSSINTPADTTLTVSWAPGFPGEQITLQSVTGGVAGPTATLDGFMLPLGAIAAGSEDDVLFILKPSFTVYNGTLAYLSAAVSEVGGTGEVLSNVLQVVPMQVTNTCPTPVPTDTAWPTSTATPTATPTETPSATTVPTHVPTATQTPTQTPVPPSPTTTPQDAAVVAPSTTPVVPPSATPAIAPSTTPIVTYKTLTRYRTITHTLLRYKVVYRTVVRYKTVRRQVVSVVYAVHVVQQPKTGRFAAPPPQQHRTAPPRPDAYMSVPRLGISSAPVWTRGYVADGDGGLTYDIVPSYGVTRFAYSVPFGLPGTTLAYGHDDIDGSIFRYLARLKVGDAVGVTVGRRRLTYIVRSVSTVSPTDVRLLTQPRVRPTLALISCTPWGVDTQRVVVIAQIQTRGGKAL